MPQKKRECRRLGVKENGCDRLASTHKNHVWAWDFVFDKTSKGTQLKWLVEVAGSRWAIEECYQQAKGQTGLDEYEVRSFDGWQRHITLSMFAHALLAMLRVETNKPSAAKNSPKK